MTMHTCVASFHTSSEIPTRREGHVHFRRRKLPLLSKRAAPSLRCWCALWRVCGRAARLGGRAGRVCWPSVTGRWHGSGYSVCCGPLEGYLALLLVLCWCCSFCAPAHTRDYAHAATAPEVWWRQDGRLGRRGRVQHALCFVMLCFVAWWVFCSAGACCARCCGRSVHGAGSCVACSRAEAGRRVCVACWARARRRGAAETDLHVCPRGFFFFPPGWPQNLKIPHPSWLAPPVWLDPRRGSAAGRLHYHGIHNAQGHSRTSHRPCSHPLQSHAKPRRGSVTTVGGRISSGSGSAR